jgi:lipase maturation factor 1
MARAGTTRLHVGDPPGRAHIRDLFLRLLGAIFLIAFLSLLVQVTVLFGARGLLPACAYLARPGPSGPTLFRFACSDGALRAGAIAGAVLSLGLVLDVAPRWCLLAVWLLYLSFVNVGQDFLSFQWDNLLLETGFFALLVAPGGLRPRDAPPPHPMAVFLMRWLVFRLHFESGAAKLLLGDPTWRDLTALVGYYETAPLPTWIGWWAHQLPLGAQRACGLFTYAAELGLPLAMWGPRVLQPAVFMGFVAFETGVIATANYGFFNYLTLVDCLWVLDDGHLAWLAARLGRTLRPAPARPPARLRDLALVIPATVLIPLSTVPFLPFVPPLRGVAWRLEPLTRHLDAIRSMNAYHLFAHMTLVRREAVIEGSADGSTWATYEFRWKPGDPDRAPTFVAPHQPRVDFQLWFLLLGPHGGARYFDTLLHRLLEAPEAVAPLFARDPFPETPPRMVRVAVYRYQFTDVATRRATGAWWRRELEGYSRPLVASVPP